MPIKDLILTPDVLNSSLVFDPTEILEELKDITFDHLRSFDLREVLVTIRECLKTVALSQIPDSNGKVGEADADFLRNSRAFVEATLRKNYLVQKYAIDLSHDHGVNALLDLTLRLDLMALEPEERLQLYRKDLQLRRKR